METALLLGQDPVFAWALQKVMADLGLALEHVYTLSEAELRLERFSYKLILLDGLREEEIADFKLIKRSQHHVILLDANPSESRKEDMTVLSKGMPIQSMATLLKEHLE
jgi:hypothetical protein